MLARTANSALEGKIESRLNADCFLAGNSKAFILLSFVLLTGAEQRVSWKASVYLSWPFGIKIKPPPLTLFALCFLPVLDQLLVELHCFLLILDNETLSGNATIQKGLLSDLLHSYRASNGNGSKKSFIWNVKQHLRGRPQQFLSLQALLVRIANDNITPGDRFKGQNWTERIWMTWTSHASVHKSRNRER